MKLSNTVVSVIAIGAALVSAYALGLLIRQVRTGSQAAAPVAAETTEAAAPGSGPGAAPTKGTPAERAQMKEQKAKVLEKMSALTKEEQEQFKDKVIKQVGGRRGGKKPGGLTPEERQARRMKAQGQSTATGETQDANAPTAPTGSPNPQQSAEKAGPTP
jgi:hypothetical protein